MKKSDSTLVCTTHACASCGGFIDGDEVKVRTYLEWLPYHPACAPEPGIQGSVFRISRSLINLKALEQARNRG